jgi:hypothetical protein
MIDTLHLKESIVMQLDIAIIETYQGKSGQLDENTFNNWLLNKKNRRATYYYAYVIPHFIKNDRLICCIPFKIIIN